LLFADEQNIMDQFDVVHKKIKFN